MHVHGPVDKPNSPRPRLTPAHAHHDQFTLIGIHQQSLNRRLLFVCVCVCVLGLAAREREWVRLYGQNAHDGKVKNVYGRTLYTVTATADSCD